MAGLPSEFTELSRSVVVDAGLGMRIGEVSVCGTDGVVVRRRYLHTPDAVAIVAVQSQALVLVREYRAAVGAAVLQVPMGKLSAGVDPRRQALVELAEETGLAAERWVRAGCLLSCPGWMNQRMHVFLAEGLRPAQGTRAGPDDVEEQHLAVEPLPIAELSDAIRAGRLVDARSIAAIQLALPERASPR
jgi:ADP-ribose pyrophosphatase